MAKKPKPVSPSFLRLMWAAIRRNPIKSIAGGLGILAAYPGAVAGARLIGAQSEPWQYASHDWVRETVDEKLKPVIVAQGGDRNILRDVQIDLANRSKRDESNNLAKWTVERDKAKDALTIDLIDKQIKESKESIEALNKQLETLKSLKGQGK